MLTEAEIKLLKSRDKRYKIYDGANLSLQVTTTGRKNWVLKTKAGSTVHLGSHPDISAKEARVLASSYYEKVKPKAECITFETVAGEWIERQEWSVSHMTDVRQKLRAYILLVCQHFLVQNLVKHINY